MPNHVTNEISIIEPVGAAAELIIDQITNAEGEFDFEMWLPMPECLKDFNPHHGIITKAANIVRAPLHDNPLVATLERDNRLKAAKEAITEDERPLVDRCVANYKETGFMYWYDWCNAVWGTKWGAYSCSRGDTWVRFDTAWAHSPKVIEAMAAQFPEVTFRIKFADEDIGSNCGAYIVKGDKILDADIAPDWSDMDDEQRAEYSRKAFELCHPDTDPREYGYNPQTMVYDEAIEDAYMREQRGES